MAQNEEVAPVVAAAPKASANKLVPLILGVNVLMMGAVLFMVMRKPAAAAAPAPVSVEVTADADKEVVQAHLPQIRDSVITYFSDRTLDELRGSDGIERTKVALMKRLDEIVPGRRVHALYVTDFIIQ